MSDLVAVEYLVANPGEGGAKIIGETFTDTSDSLEKFLPWGAVVWGYHGGDYFIANETTPLPSAIYADGVGLISATAAPGSSDVGLVVRVAGEVSMEGPSVSGATLANVATSTASATLFSANSDRKAAMIWNDSSSILYVKFGATASATSCTVPIAANGYYELPQPCYLGVIDAVLSSSTGVARTTELA